MMHSFAKIVIQAIVMITIFLIGTVKPAAQSMMTVEDAIALALQYNYDIQMSMEDSSSAALDYEYRNAVFFPGSMQPQQRCGIITLKNRNLPMQIITGKEMCRPIMF